MKFQVIWVSRGEVDPTNDNIDVEVRLTDGRRFAGTFFTPRNIESLLQKYAETGECRHGLYLWTRGMVIIRNLTRESIQNVIQQMIDDGELESALELLE